MKYKFSQEIAVGGSIIVSVEMTLAEIQKELHETYGISADRLALLSPLRTAYLFSTCVEESEESDLTRYEHETEYDLDQHYESFEITLEEVDV